MTIAGLVPIICHTVNTWYCIISWWTRKKSVTYVSEMRYIYLTIRLHVAVSLLLRHAIVCLFFLLSTALYRTKNQLLVASSGMVLLVLSTQLVVTHVLRSWLLFAIIFYACTLLYMLHCKHDSVCPPYENSGPPPIGDETAGDSFNSRRAVMTVGWWHYVIYYYKVHFWSASGNHIYDVHYRATRRVRYVPLSHKWQ